MKSEKSFLRLQKLLIALFIVEIIAGLAIAVACEYAKELVQNRIFQFDKQQVLSVFFIVKLFGLHVSFYFLCGVPLVLLFNDVYTHHMGFLLKLWLLLAVETAIGCLLMIWCFTDASKHLVAKFETALLEGIKLFPKDPVWVLIWDDLQYDFKCCGVYGHMDWTKVNLTTVLNRHEMRQSKDFSWLPYSCANANIVSKALLDENVHVNGCFTVVVSIINYVTTTILSLNFAIIAFLVSRSLKSYLKTTRS